MTSGQRLIMYCSVTGAGIAIGLLVVDALCSGELWQIATACVLPLFAIVGRTMDSKGAHRDIHLPMPAIAVRPAYWQFAAFVLMVILMFTMQQGWHIITALIISIIGHISLFSTDLKARDEGRKEGYAAARAEYQTRLQQRQSYRQQ